MPTSNFIIVKQFEKARIILGLKLQKWKWIYSCAFYEVPESCSDMGRKTKKRGCLF
jgi:hypothetical protein